MEKDEKTGDEIVLNFEVITSVLPQKSSGTAKHQALDNKAVPVIFLETTKF